jgi:hypothetical protein
LAIPCESAITGSKTIAVVWQLAPHLHRGVPRCLRSQQLAVGSQLGTELSYLTSAIHYAILGESPPGVPNHMSNPFFLDWIAKPSPPRSNDLNMDWILRWNWFHVPKLPDLEGEFLSSNPNFQLRKAENRCV